MKTRTLKAGKLNSPLSQDGFTLLELIVVMVLAATLLGVALPGLTNRLIVNDTRKTINWFVKNLPDLRSRARLAGRDIELCFDLHMQTLTTSYAQKQSSLQAESLDNGVIPDQEKRMAALPQGITLPEGVMITDVLFKKTVDENTPRCLVVRAAGFCDETIIHITDEDGDSYSCRIQPFLNEVKVYDKFVTFQ